MIVVVDFLNFVYQFLTSVTHAQSSGLLKKFLESSVFIIGLELDVPELCVNVKQIWVNCGVSHLKAYTVTTDLKLCNVLLGMMSHSSCHPCAWCDTPKDTLNKNSNNHTIANWMKLFWDFLESYSEKTRCKKFWECNTSPLCMWQSK